MRLINADVLLIKLDSELNADARYIDIADQIRDIINETPPVKTYCYFCGQTEHGIRPHDKWITFPTNHSIIQCPECTALLNNLRVDVFKDKIGEMNFCPNCGADMRKGEDNR